MYRSIVFPTITYLQVQVHTTEDDPRFIACFKTVVMDDLKARIQNWPYLDKYKISIALDPSTKDIKEKKGLFQLQFLIKKFL